jgi:hypothetical protein
MFAPAAVAPNAMSKRLKLRVPVSQERISAEPLRIIDVLLSALARNAQVGLAVN